MSPGIFGHGHPGWSSSVTYGSLAVDDNGYRVTHYLAASAISSSTQMSAQELQRRSHSYPFRLIIFRFSRLQFSLFMCSLN
jgi:hypothetical protein